MDLHNFFSKLSMSFVLNSSFFPMYIYLFTIEDTKRMSFPKKGRCQHECLATNDNVATNDIVICGMLSFVANVVLCATLDPLSNELPHLMEPNAPVFLR